MIYGLFAVALRHAFRQGRFAVLELCWAACYGFLLEWIAIKQLHAYHYGQFIIMLDDAPLCVALGWAVVIYSSMRFSSGIQLPSAVRPILDALLGLNIDVAIDVIAIRLGFWTWSGVASNQQWFGVPWANFAAWFMVIWSYSGFIRALRSWQQDRIRRWLYPLVAMLLSLLVLIILGASYRILSDPTNPDNGIAPLFLVAGSVIIIWASRPKLEVPPLLETSIVSVPIVFHAFALLAGLYYGIFGQQPVLGLIGIGMFVCGIAVHVLPWWITRPHRAGKSHPQPDIKFVAPINTDVPRLAFGVYNVATLELWERRCSMSSLIRRADLKPGMQVRVVQKQDQSTGKLTVGIVDQILTKSPTHPHGIKVRLVGGIVGRVKDTLD